MKLFPKTKVQTLAQWVVIATWKLVEPAKERIRAEIEAHYAEAVEAHQENGMSETNARAAALAELGDPKAAGRRFCKNHLTKGEEQHLKNWNKSARSVLVLAINYSLFLSFVFDQLQRDAFDHYHNVPLGLSLEFLATIVLPTTCFVVARRFKSKFNKNLLLMMQFLPGYGVVPGILLDALLRGKFSHFEYWVWSIAFFLHFLFGLRIWKKFGQTGMFPDYAPPPNTTETSA